MISSYRTLTGLKPTASRRPLSLSEGVTLPTSRYHTLQLIHFYTCGADEVKCWTIRDGWTAPKAAGTIHTDFERGFIKAEARADCLWHLRVPNVSTRHDAGRTHSSRTNLSWPNSRVKKLPTVCRIGHRWGNAQYV